jgi:hypothetical protein
MHTIVPSFQNTRSNNEGPLRPNFHTSAACTRVSAGVAVRLHLLFHFPAVVYLGAQAVLKLCRGRVG